MKTPAQELGEAIAKDREKNQISQERIAAAVGVTQQAYSGWEAGVSMPRTNRLKLLLDFFGRESETSKTIEHIVPKSVYAQLNDIDVTVVGQREDGTTILRTQLKPPPEKARSQEDQNLYRLTFNANKIIPGTSANKRRVTIRKITPTGQQTGVASSPPPMDSDDAPNQVNETRSHYGIRSFEEQQSTHEMHEALSRAAKGVDLARQVLDDASVQLAKAMQQLQKA